MVVKTKNTAEIWVAGGVCGHEKGGHPIITDSMECYNLTSDDDGGWSWKELIIRLRIPRYGVLLFMLYNRFILFINIGKVIK